MSKRPAKGSFGPLLSEVYEPQPAPKPSRLALSLQHTDSGSFSPGFRETTQDNSAELAELLERALGLSTERKQRPEAPASEEKSAFTIQPATTMHSKTHSTVPAHSQPASPSALEHELQRSRFLNSRLSELTQRYHSLQQAYDTLTSGSMDCQYREMYVELEADGRREKEKLVRRVRALEEELARVRKGRVVPISTQVVGLSKRLAYLELRLSDLEQ